MAKSGSFSSRFPHFKLFLFLAVVIALPLTVFSVQKVSTSTEQHAAGVTPTPMPLPAPTGLVSSSFCSGSRSEVKFSWKRVNLGSDNANMQYEVQYNYGSGSYNGYTSTGAGNNGYAPTSYTVGDGANTPMGKGWTYGQKFQGRVRVFNGNYHGKYTRDYGPWSITVSGTAKNCRTGAL